MADISTRFDEALAQHNARISHHRRFQSDVVDEFLKEAYRINSHISSLHIYLLSIRQAYLSTSTPPRHSKTHRSTPSYANGKAHGGTASSSQRPTHLTDPQRDAIDTESKSTLQSLAASLSQLEAAERLRRDTESQVLDKKRNRNPRYAKSLFRWAAGDDSGGMGGTIDKRTDEEKEEDSKRECLDTHRANVIWYLKMKLREAVAVQGGMVEIRIEREVERGKSLFWKSTGKEGPNGITIGTMQGSGEGRKEWKGSNGHMGEKGGGSSEGMEDYRGKRGNLGIDEMESKEIEKQLSPEQLRLFAEENQEMVKQYEDKLEQVRTAESSLLEISSLQSQLASSLDIQESQITALVEDSANTTTNVTGGNKELKRAIERWRPARMVFWTTVGLCGFLVSWDLIF